MADDGVPTDLTDPILHGPILFAPLPAEGFQKWRITFDGFCLRSSYDQMCTGMLAEGPKSHVRLDLDVDCGTPVWDAASAGDGMAEQSWAREHYEQLTRVMGRLVVDGVAVDFNGGGWRDHSRGPWGADTLKDWGGHVITGGVLPSGRAFGMCRYWARDGHTMLEDAYVVEDGVLRQVGINVGTSARGARPRRRRLFVRTRRRSRDRRRRAVVPVDFDGRLAALRSDGPGAGRHR
jgi:hypothetical protein